MDRSPHQYLSLRRISRHLYALAQTASGGPTIALSRQRSANRHRHPRKAARDAIGRGLVHWDWFAGRLDQPVSFEQDAVALRLRLEQKADRHKSRAAQQSNQHYPTVRLLIRVMKRMGHVATQHWN
jgi:hypothetical protein